MGTQQIQISDIYNSMPMILEPANIGIDNQIFKQKTFISEIKTQGPTKVKFAVKYLKEYAFTAQLDSNDLVLKYVDEASGLDFQIKLIMNEDVSGGTISLNTNEPSIQAGILSTRLWYLFISNKYPLILLKDDNTYRINVNSYPEEHKKKLLYRGKIFRKLAFIESCLKEKLDKLKIPKHISSNDVALIDTIFRGMTRGNVYTVGDSFSTKQSPSSEIDPRTRISNVPGAYSFSLNEMSLFNQLLPLGKIDIIFPYAMANYKEESDGTIELNFKPLNEQVIFHFNEYSKNLPKQYALLQSFKEKLSKKEPRELAELTDEPLLGDVSSIEASEIAVGWLFAQMKSVRVGMKVQKTELDELGKNWKIEVWLLETAGLQDGSVATVPLLVFIDKLTGKVSKVTSSENKEFSAKEIEKIAVEMSDLKTSLKLSANNKDLEEQ